MAGPALSEKLRLFIFESIDSVELIEVLLYLRTNRERWLTPQELSQEFRSSPGSVSGRFGALQSLGLVESQERAGVGSFRYAPKTPELDELVGLLDEEYKLRPHKVLELVFSPTKHMKDFAHAFVITKPTDKKGKPDG